MSRMTLPNSRPIKIISVLGGALPAAFLGLGAALNFFGALDQLTPLRSGSIAGPILGMLMSIAGVIGAIGSWIVIFDVGTRSRVGRPFLLITIFLGISAVSWLAGLTIYHWDRSGEETLPWISTILWASVYVPPLGIAVYHFARISRIEAVHTRLLVALLPVLAATVLLAGQALASVTYYVDYEMEIRCPTRDLCNPHQGELLWMELLPVDSRDSVFVKLPAVGWQGAGSPQSGTVAATLRVQLFFGRWFKSYQIVRLGTIDIPERVQKNQRRPPTASFPAGLSLRRQPSASNI